MNKKALICFISFLSFSILKSWAQLAITSGGGEASGTTGSISYSVGQIVNNSISGSNGSLEQGVIQLTKNNNNPLPVELLNFNVKINANNTVVLTWTTASETNNDFFIIERSYDGKEFEVLGKVNGGGTSTQQQEYFYLDQNPIKNQSYYRLKQTDFNGKYTYSQIISVFNRSSHSLYIYPNPTFQYIILHNILDDYKDLSFTIQNTQGKIVSHAKINKAETKIDFSNLAPGVYIFTLIEENAKKETYKIIKN